MSEPYSLPYFGSVEIEHRLIEYDGPRLFTVRAESGARLLAFWAKQQPQESIYWYSNISDLRYQKLLNGVIDLREMLLQPEGNYVLEAHWSENAQEYTDAGFKLPQDLDQAALPESGLKLPPLAGASASINTIGTSNFLALQLNRFVARLAFDFGRDDHEAPAANIGSTVSALQDVLDAFGEALTGQPRERGIIAEKVTSKTALAFRTVFASSFGIELAAEEASDLFGRSLASDTFDSLIDLLQAGSDAVQLRSLFGKLRGRSAKRYRTLMQNFADAEADIKFDIGRPSKDGARHLVLERTAIPAIVAALYIADTEETLTEEFDAELVGHNKRTRSFEVRRLIDDKKYTGKVTGLAVNAARNAEISHIYQVRIAATREFDPMIQRDIEKYELFELGDAPNAKMAGTTFR